VTSGKAPQRRSQHLFVYGTLRGDMSHGYGSVLKAHAALVGTARFNGQLFDVGEYPGAIASSSACDSVVGELYRIDDAAAAALFAELDRYEGFEPQDTAASEFVRVRIAARTEDGDSIEAWMYQYNRPTGGLRRIESGDYKEAGG
jgi:pyruvate carboxylase